MSSKLLIRMIGPSVLKFLACTILLTTVGSIGLVVTSPTIAQAQNESRSQSVDGVTDWLFGNVNPQLKRRKLRSNEYAYIREWNVIRNVINDGGLAYSNQNPNPRVDCGTSRWYFSNKDEALRERLADAIFYHRNPQRRGAPIQAHEKGAMREWAKLKNSMYVAYC